MTLRGRGMPTIGRGRRGDQRVVVNVVIPRNLTARQRELLEELRDSLTDENLAEPRRRVAARQGQARVPLIRLAVRAPAEDAERVLAELLELAPAGVEQVDGDGWVEYALYGAPGRAAGAPARARPRWPACASA